MGAGVCVVEIHIFPVASAVWLGGVEWSWWGGVAVVSGWVLVGGVLGWVGWMGCLGWGERTGRGWLGFVRIGVLVAWLGRVVWVVARWFRSRNSILSVRM